MNSVYTFISKNISNIFLKYGIVVAVVVYSVILSFLSPHFLTGPNIINILLQSSINIIVACGMTAVIISGGIDLSSGSLIAFSGVYMAGAGAAGWPPLLIFAVPIIAGLVWGSINGILCTYGKLPDFIATLATAGILRGLALIYTKGGSIYNFPQIIRIPGAGYVAGIPVPVILSVLMLILTYILLELTPWGRQIYALGSNKVAARYAAIKVNKIKTLAYIFSGLCGAFAGAVMLGRLGSGEPTAGLNYELDAIAAVVLGGTSFNGGSGHIAGTMVGALLITIIRNSLVLLNVDAFLQQIIIGLVLITAVGIDQIRK